jgi:hypothetical protein
MTIVSSYDFESDTWTHHHGEPPARQAYRQAVAEIAAKAKETLPACHGRVDKAVAIVLNGDVELLDGGKAKVASQSNGTTTYFVVNGTCECRDFPKAPSGWCKHRIAAGLAKRVAARVRAELDAPANGQAAPASESTAVQASPAVPPSPLPEAPASANVYVTLAGRQVQVTLRDRDEGKLLARLATLLERFPVETEPKQEHGADWCTKHSTAMKLYPGKDGSTWYSHKTADGWCKGK